MIGEAFREVGVLTLVFAILDSIISNKNTLLWTTLALAISTVAFALGCYIERNRPE